jgi:hypothetical protein
MIRLPPALVISLDFELHWGVRDIHPAGSPFMDNILGARAAVPRMLDVFAGFDVAATWATVGFLMAESREELEAYYPDVRPAYADVRLDPYRERIGRDEREDPLHFAPGLVRMIAAAPRQEVGTHTFSHFYCLEAGAEADAFRADLASATGLATSKGIVLRSIVLPRNQWHERFAPHLLESGIECYRGPQAGWMHAALPGSEQSRARRAARLLDAHLPMVPWQGARWGEVVQASGLGNIPGSSFLRPVGRSRTANALRLARVKSAMTDAARKGRIFHLWWHPHNFGSRTDENLVMLRHVLQHFRKLQSAYGMQSLSMLDAARLAAAGAVPSLEQTGG